MRRPPPLQLAVAVACAAALVAGCADPAPATPMRQDGGGFETLLLRVPRAGGAVGVYRPGADSALWRSREPAPATRALLGFDEYLGTLLGQDSSGRAYGLNLRVGAVERIGTAPLAALVAAEGAAVFTQDSAGDVVRLTPVSSWRWRPPQPADAIVPLPDGGALVVATMGTIGSVIRRIRPPGAQAVDSLDLPATAEWRRTTAADLVWGLAGNEIVALRVRDLTEVFREGVSGTVRAIESTPSGDRLFVATQRAALQVVDRFAEDESPAVDLPGPVRALRMDPDGAFLLAQAADGARVFVVAIGTSRVVATVESDWAEDLPVVGPEATVVVRDGADVVTREIASGRERSRIAGGAADLWRAVRWDGFRPRRANLDRRLGAEVVTDSAAADSAFAAMVRSRYGLTTDTALAAEPPVEGAAPTTVPAAEAPPAAPAAAPAAPAAVPEVRPPGERWMVGFATLGDEGSARRLVEGIRGARMVPTRRDGAPAWRIVLGPYPSREAAERAGVGSGRAFWVFEELP